MIVSSGDAVLRSNPLAGRLLPQRQGRRPQNGDRLGVADVVGGVFADQPAAEAPNIATTSSTVRTRHIRGNTLSTKKVRCGS